MQQTAPFDGMAADYDRSFTASSIGQRMRAVVWHRLATAFRSGERVLELNCGTGEDAVHLGSRGVRVLATDTSELMIEKARIKVAAAGLAEQIETRRLAM